MYNAPEDLLEQWFSCYGNPKHKMIFVAQSSKFATVMSYHMNIFKDRGFPRELYSSQIENHSSKGTDVAVEISDVD